VAGQDEASQVASEAKRLRQLEDKNAKPKKLLG
jgi:hypothetical protein